MCFSVGAGNLRMNPLMPQSAPYLWAACWIYLLWQPTWLFYSCSAVPVWWKTCGLSWLGCMMPGKRLVVGTWSRREAQHGSVTLGTEADKDVDGPCSSTWHVTLVQIYKWRPGNAMQGKWCADQSKGLTHNCTNWISKKKKVPLEVHVSTALFS